MSVCRVLVVDDETSLRTTISANLELEGFEVVEAENGLQALERLREGRFDLVLSDVRMPGMNGVELFGRIRELDPHLPVILMTAFAMEELLADAIKGGAFTVMSKPFEIEHLVRALSTAARHPVVLVVDDAQPVAESTAAALCAMGVKARAVYDGPSAVELARQGSVDVCVVDMVMPGWNGPEVIEQMRKLDLRIAFVAVSGHDVQEMFRRNALSVETFMRKPVDPEDLIQVIARARSKAAQR